MSQPATQLPPQPEAVGAVVALGGTGLVRLAAAHRHRQQALALLARNHLRRLWRAVDPTDPQGSWGALGRRATALLTVAQAEAARGASDYVAAALTLQGVASDPFGSVPVQAFAGTAADGRALDTLLGYPAFEASAFIDQGMDPAEAVAIGGRHLDRIVTTETADAARVSTGVAIVNDRRAQQWTRMLTPPSCSRCVILAGQTYSTNAGASFQRHPGCDCIAVPAAEMVEPISPMDIFDTMSDEELKKAGWSAADVRAIRDGADIYQVTNAHRELKTVTIAGQQLQATGHGATRRGLAGKRLGAPTKKRAVRLTPASIYAEAGRLGWSRDELLRVLKLHGYIL